jgi:hypothetical protein
VLFRSPKISFSLYGERGAIDQLGWHARARHLLVIELKTELVDVNELLGTFDRKIRLARVIARERGMVADAVSGWLVVLDTRTNRRHAASHPRLLGARFPADARALRSLVAEPDRPAAFGVAFWTDSRAGAASHDPAKSRSLIRVARAGPASTPRTGKTESRPDRLAQRPVVPSAPA